MSDTSIDKVTLRVIGGAFDSIAKEMAHVLYRMSNSSIIRESEDIGCGIFDSTGQELAKVKLLQCILGHFHSIFVALCEN